MLRALCYVHLLRIVCGDLWESAACATALSAAGFPRSAELASFVVVLWTVATGRCVALLAGWYGRSHPWGHGQSLLAPVAMIRLTVPELRLWLGPYVAHRALPASLRARGRMCLGIKVVFRSRACSACRQRQLWPRCRC